MTKLRTDQAQCIVHVYREGLFSSIGHDVELEFRRLEVDVGEDDRISATFDLRSLDVVGALENGKIKRDKLSASDRRDILDNAAKALDVHKHPKAVFESEKVERSEDSVRVSGLLTLHGESESVDVTASRTDGTWVARLTLHQPAYGIKPFKALLGGLKIKPDVDIEMRIPDSRA